MNRRSVQEWLENYIEAWRTYEASQIGDLFSEDALYLHSPFNEQNPARGRAAIVANWLQEPDAPGSWEAHYEPVAVEDNVAVAQGRTRYFQPDGSLEQEFANIFVMHFDELGRCTRFTEYYMVPDGT